MTKRIQPYSPEIREWAGRIGGVNLLSTSAFYVETTTEDRVIDGATFVSGDGTVT